MPKRIAILLAAYGLAIAASAAGAEEPRSLARGQMVSMGAVEGGNAAISPKTWNPGAVGSYFDPANWSGGAPGAGDTVLVRGPGSNLVFFDPANNPIKFSPDPAPSGFTISGQTITFQAEGGTESNPAIQGEFSNTSFGADTIVNAIGPGVTRIEAWFDNSLAGRAPQASANSLPFPAENPSCRPNRSWLALPGFLSSPSASSNGLAAAASSRPFVAPL